MFDHLGFLRFVELSVSLEDDEDITLAWQLVCRCIKAVAYTIQEPGMRWQDAHALAWEEWLSVWGDECPFPSPIMYGLALFLQDEDDGPLSRLAVYIDTARSISSDIEEESEWLDVDDCDPDEDECHLVLAVDNGDILMAPNPSPPQLELVD